MRKLLIVGNWKMYLNASQASLLVHRLQERIKIRRDIEVVLAPSMLVLQPLSVQIGRRKFRLAAQNAYFHDEGAFTGEVSFTMLRELVHYTIVGHSERRHIFSEDLPMIRDKVAAAIGHVAAKPSLIQAAVNYIRGYVRDVFNEKAAKNLRVLYGGGDVAPEVVQGILSVP